MLSSNGTLGCSLGCCKAGSAEEQQELSLGKKGLPVGINIYVGVARLFFFEAVVGVIFAMYRRPIFTRMAHPRICQQTAEDLGSLLSTDPGLCSSAVKVHEHMDRVPVALYTVVIILI